MSVLNNGINLLLAADAAASGYQVSRSLRFNASDSAFLSRAVPTAGSLTAWTWAGWVKRSSFDTTNNLFAVYPGSNFANIRFVNQNIDFAEYTGGSYSGRKITTAVFRDPSAWYHIVATWDTTNGTAADRMRLYVNGVRVDAFSTSTNPGPSATSVINTAVTHRIGTFEGSTEFFNGYLADVHFLDGIATDPSSFTDTDAITGQLVPKAYTGSYGTNGFRLAFDSYATTAALGTDTSGTGTTWTVNNFSSNPNPIYSNNLLAGDGTNTIINRTNGFDGNIATQSVNPSGANNDNADFLVTFSPPITVSTGLRFYAFAATSRTISFQVNSLTRQSVTNSATDWIDTGFTGTLTSLRMRNTNGTQQALNAIEVNSIILVDGAGANNDSLVDTPTSGSTVDTGLGGQVTGNYCTWNPLLPPSTTLSNGNLDCTTSGNGNMTGGTVGVSSGKWYFEITYTGGGACSIGIAPPGFRAELGSSATSYAYKSSGVKYTNGSDTSYGASYSSGDVIGVALDLDAGTLVFYKNGTSQGTAFSSLSGTFTPGFGRYTATETSCSANFGQRAFAYTAPSGFKALVDTNLPAPVVAKPDQVFQTKLYTGNGGTQNITGLAFNPDFVWIKQRSGTNSHRLFDSVRGTTKQLYSDLTFAEDISADSLTAFNSDGFSVGSMNAVNISSGSFVSWNWDAGTTTVTNTAGSISSQVRANASAGFSVVTYTATGSTLTVGHGLGVAPQMIIIKGRTSTASWAVYTKAVGTSAFLLLNSTAAAQNYNVWNNTSPTSTVFTVGAPFDEANTAGVNHVAYCFAPVSGYSSMGSYVGNGSSDGPFVFTGMRPRWLLVKSSSYVDEWRIYDAVRLGYNAVATVLTPGDSQAEGATGYPIDLLSNGFKLRGPGGPINESGQTYIYCAFAESPFQYARAR